MLASMFFPCEDFNGETGTFLSVATEDDQGQQPSRDFERMSRRGSPRMRCLKFATVARLGSPKVPNWCNADHRVEQCVTSLAWVSRMLVTPCMMPFDETHFRRRSITLRG